MFKNNVGHCELPPSATPSRSPTPSPTSSPIPSPTSSPTPASSSAPAPPSDGPHPCEQGECEGILSDEEKDRLKERIRKVGGCNANVCFAIDGSSSINSEEFQAEKHFVQDVVSVLSDNPVEFAAVQFSTSTTNIQSLTPDDAGFLIKVENAKQVPGLSFVRGGLNYCVFQLLDRPGESNKIVLLSDGRSNVGGSTARRAQQFRDFGGNVCVVGAGNQNKKELLNIVGGDSNLYHQVHGFTDFFTLAKHIISITEDICGLNA